MTSHCTLLLLKLCSIWSSSPQRLVHGCNYSTTTSSGIVSGGQRSRATTGAAASRPHISSSHSVYHFSSVTFVSWMMTVCWLGWPLSRGNPVECCLFWVIIEFDWESYRLVKIDKQFIICDMTFYSPSHHRHSPTLHGWSNCMLF